MKKLILLILVLFPLVGFCDPCGYYTSDKLDFTIKTESVRFISVQIGKAFYLKIKVDDDIFAFETKSPEIAYIEMSKLVKYLKTCKFKDKKETFEEMVNRLKILYPNVFKQ